MNTPNKIKKNGIWINGNIWISIAILMILVVVIYHNWFWLNSVFFSGDAAFRFDEFTKTLLTSYNTWLNANTFGDPNIQLYFFLSRAFWSLLSYINIPSVITLKFSHLLPIAFFSLLAPFVLLKKITKNNWISLVGGIFYGTTTYLFATISRGHLPIAFIYALSPLIFYFFILALEKNRFNNWLIFTLVYWVGTSYEPRIMYILTVVLLLYFLSFNFFNLKKYFSNIVLSLLIFLALNFFWLSPVLFGRISDTIKDVVTRGIFGSYLFSLTKSITLFHFSWTGVEPTSFTVQKIPWFFWITPLTLLALSVLVKITKYKKIIIFFWIISLFGIFVSKQESDPLSGAFPWLYDNLPTFRLFRNGLKFYLVTAIGYLGLIGCLLLLLKDSKNKLLSKYVFAGFSIIVLSVSLYNAKPIITGEIGTMFTPKLIPADYLKLKDFISKQSGFFRTFWVPTNSRWGFFTNRTPIISNVATVGSSWNNLLRIHDPDEKLIQNTISDVFRSSFSNNLIDLSSIKFVIVPLQDKANDDDPFRSYGGASNPNIRNWYISELDKVAWLNKIDIGTKELAVYENNGYKPPIFAFINLYNLNSLTNLEDKYSFVTEQLKNDFYFTTEDNARQNSPLAQVNGLFESISPDNIDNSVLQASIDRLNGGNNNTLYIKSDSGDVYVTYKNNKITFYSQPEGSLFLNDSEIFKNTGQKTIIESIPVTSDNKYYLLLDNQSFIINPGDVLDLGVSGQDRTVKLSTFANNIIPNPSFENGLWQKTVGDCNRGDDNSVMAMSLDEENKTDGKKALQLEATTHIACTAINIPITEPGEYLLSFDYQSPNSNQAGYHLGFNDDKKTVFKYSPPIVDKAWGTYAQKIYVPEGSTTGSLYVYAFSKDNATNIINRYDNIKLQKIFKSESVIIAKTKDFIRIPLTSGKEENFFAYKNKNYDYNNLIPNPSFESGFWTEKVEDCHNFDDNPMIAMKMDLDEKTDGAGSLQLEAARHIACTHIELPVKSGRNYLLSFDYQSPNASVMSYYVSFNDNARTAITENIPISDAQWKKYTRSLTVPGGANRLTLNLYAKPNVGTENTVNRYDNFRLIENPNLADVYYLVSEGKSKLKVPSAVDFDLINPTKKLVHIKGAAMPFYLALSDSYHPQWQLQLNDEKIHGVLASWLPFVNPNRVKDEDHYKLYDFLNAWYVDPSKLCGSNTACKLNPDGSYDMEMVLEFWPQRWFYLGLVVSIATLAGSLGYLGYAGIKSYRSNMKQKEEPE